MKQVQTLLSYQSLAGSSAAARNIIMPADGTIVEVSISTIVTAVVANSITQVSLSIHSNPSTQGLDTPQDVIAFMGSESSGATNGQQSTQHPFWPVKRNQVLVHTISNLLAATAYSWITLRIEL